jgi:hypothetical protein
MPSFLWINNQTTDDGCQKTDGRDQRKEGKRVRRSEAEKLRSWEVGKLGS